MKQLNNLVLIKPNTSHYEHITLKSGLVLWFDQSFEKEQHACTSGTIVGLPEKVVYPKPFKPQMELQIGDEVIFHYLDHSNAKSNGTMDKDGNMFLPYDFLYLAIRNGEVIMLNGYIVVEGIKETISSNKLIIPDANIKQDETKGIVRYAGTPLEDGFDYPEILPGMKIVFPKHCSVPLQFQLHQIVDPDKVLYRMRYSDILAIMDSDPLEIEIA